MADRAVLTFLGFPSWGPLHLMLSSRADPEALAQRFRQAEHLVEVGPPTTLLAAFVHCHADLEPLEHPSPQGWLANLGVEYRYLVVCRYGAPKPLRISSWSWCPEAQHWARHRGPIHLDQFLEHHSAKTVAKESAYGKRSPLQHGAVRALIRPPAGALTIGIAKGPGP